MGHNINVKHYKKKNDIYLLHEIAVIYKAML